MAVTVVNNATTIWDCESTSGSVGNKPALETEILKEGSNSVAFTTTQTTTESSFDGTIPDLTGEHVRIWYTSITFPNMASKVLGGVCFYADDGSNIAYWSLGGKDTYSGGWINGLVYIDSTPDSGSVDSSNISEMGIIHMNGFGTSSYATRPKNQINAWVDYLRYGNGLLAYGSPTFGIDELALADQAGGSGYGIVDTANETHFIYGSIEYGRTSEQTIYEDESELMIFANANVSATLYGIKFTGNTSVTSTFSIKTSVISSAGERFFLDFDDSNIADLVFRGNTVTHANNITLLSSNTLTDISLNSFNDCSTITVGNAIFNNNNISTSGLVTVGSSGSFSGNVISESIATSAVQVSSLEDLDACTFNSSGTGHGINLGTVSTASMNWNCFETGYTDLSSGDETILVSVNNGETLTINVQPGASTPSVYNTGSGSVNIVVGQVTTTITVRDKITKAKLENVMVYVVAGATGSMTAGDTIINKVLTDVNGQVSDTRSLSSDQSILGRARLATGGSFYKTEPIDDTISSANGLNLNLYLIKDD